MRHMSTNVHVSTSDCAKLGFGEVFRWIELSGKSEILSGLTLHFPETVPAEKLQAIADAINDALDAAQPVNIEEAA